jgi:phosphoglucomutase
VKAIAQKHGLKVLETPTGFKYIGAAAEKAAWQGKRLLFGCEDSCGYLIGDYARDKDGILGAGLLALAAVWHAGRNSNFLKRLAELEREFGCHLESIEQLNAPGKDWDCAFENVRSYVIGCLRGRQGRFAGMEIMEFRDYYSGKAFSPQTGFSYNLDYCGERTVQITLSGDSQVTFRPSGTESKFKIYIAVHEPDRAEAIRKQERLRQEALSLVKEI